MFQIYVGKVYNIQLEELEQAQLLSFFLKGDGMAIGSRILVYEGECIKGCISYRDVLFHREIIYKQFVHSGSVFEDVLSYINEENIVIEDNMCFPVVNEQGELMYILEYLDNNNFVNHRGFVYEERISFPKYLDYKVNDASRMDWEILDRADIFVFKEFNEYSYAMSRILRTMPDKIAVFLDERALLFYDEMDGHVKVMNANCLDDFLISEKKRVLCVYKYNEWDFERNCFGIINVFHSIFWLQKCVANINEKCEYLVLDFAKKIDEAGLVAQLREYSVLRDYARKMGLKFVVKNSQYMMYEPQMLCKYFDIGLTIPESPIESSQSVVIQDLPDLVDSYFYKKRFRECVLDLEHGCTDYLKGILEKCKEAILPSDKRVLGCLVRGSDYRGVYMHSKQKDVATVMERAKKMMEYDGYEYIYLATEDQDVFEKFQRYFGERLLYVDQYRYSNKEFVDGIKVIAQLSVKEEEESRMLEYAKVIYVLSKCTSLLASGGCGGVEAAKNWNKEQYEEVYVYDLGLNE